MLDIALRDRITRTLETRAGQPYRELAPMFCKWLTVCVLYKEICGDVGMFDEDNFWRLPATRCTYFIAGLFMRLYEQEMWSETDFVLESYTQWHLSDKLDTLRGPCCSYWDPMKKPCYEQEFFIGYWSEFEVEKVNSKPTRAQEEAGWTLVHMPELIHDIHICYQTLTW